MTFDVFIKKLDEITLNDMHFSTKQNGDWLEIYLNHGGLPAFKISLTETFHLVTVGKIRGLFDEWKKIADLCWEFASTPIHERFVPYVLTTGTGDEKVYFKFEVMNSGKTVMVVTSKPEVYRDFILKFYEDTDSELRKLINLTKEVTRRNYSMKIDEFKATLNQLAYTATNTRSGIISVYTHNYWGEDDANGWCFRLAPARKTVIVGKQWDKLDGMPVFCVRDLLNLIAELEKTPVKDRLPEKKYTIQVIANYDSAYLNCQKEDNSMTFCDDIETDHVKTRFTQSEIDKLKQRPDLAIDWNKAIIKEAKDDED